MPNGEIFQQVAADVERGFKGTFDPDPEQQDAVVPHPAFEGAEPIANDVIAAVPWVYRCVHDGDFEGMFRTNRKLEIHGVTFVDNRKSETTMHRLVDWMGVVTQLGLEVSWRVPIDREQYIAGRRPSDPPD